MKGRESGMPDEAYCETFFEPEAVVERLLCEDGALEDVVEFGCGYGTFTIAAARRAQGTVTALDIEPEMGRSVREKAALQNVGNVCAAIRDFVGEGTGLKDA